MFKHPFEVTPAGAADADPVLGRDFDEGDVIRVLFEDLGDELLLQAQAGAGYRIACFCCLFRHLRPPGGVHARTRHGNALA